MKTSILIATLAILTSVPASAAPTPGRAASASRSRPSATAAWKPVVPFIEDDFGRALALARERKLPVFIEGWAPW